MNPLAAFWTETHLRSFAWDHTRSVDLASMAYAESWGMLETRYQTQFRSRQR